MPQRLSTSGHVLADRVRHARTPVARMRGLLGRRGLQPGEALLLEPAAQVHTVGMPAPIDVMFCDRNLVVLRIERELRPRRVTRWVRGSRYVIELPAGAVPDSVRPGDRVEISEGPRPDP